METIAIISKEEIRTIIKETLKSSLIELDEEKKILEDDRLFTINQVAKKLHRNHSTVKRLIKDGYIEPSLDGKITGAALRKFLNSSLVEKV